MIGLALVAQIAVVASAPPTAVSCVPFDVSVAARAPGAVAPRIDLPSVPGLQVLASRVTSRVDRFGSGESSALTEATFTIALGATGRVSIPPFVATAAGQRGAASALPIEVARADDASPRVLVRARLDPERDSVFVGQQLDYVVDVQLNDVARQRLRRNPTFFPPEMPGVLAYDQALPPPPRRTGPHCFESLTYRRALFPLFAGAVTIPPATLSYSLPVSTSFFSREESFSLSTDSVRFLAAEPPAQGRPQGFIGAVGQLRASARLATTSARMGDPVLLTLRLEAVGNVKLLPRPVLDLPWASIALGEERVDVDSTAPQVRGTKEFDWLLTPRRAGALVIPGIRYPFFDPSRLAYDIAITDSLPLDVSPAALVASDSAPAVRFGIRTTLREERGAPLPARPWFWAVLVLAPAPAALQRLRLRRRRRARRDPPLRRLQALATSSAPDASRTRRAFLDVLTERAPALATSARHAPLARSLRRVGVTDLTADRAASLLAELDAAAFAGQRAVPPDLVTRALDVARAVDAEAIRPPTTRNATMFALIATLGVGALAASAMPRPLARAFVDGVTAYRHGDFGGAERLFARVSARAPRATDAWANLGTAAWARGDSALAAVGWQRALRLDPLDAEARDRFAAVQSTSFSDAAYVPPVPVDAVAAAAIILWAGAWILLAVPAVRRAAGVRPMAGGAVALSVIFLLAALELQHRSAVGGLAALRTGRSLLEAPSSDGGAVAAANAGEVGALGAREGAWVRIDLDGDRAGWVPVAAVLPLDDPVE